MDWQLIILVLGTIVSYIGAVFNKKDRDLFLIISQIYLVGLLLYEAIKRIG